MNKWAVLDFLGVLRLAAIALAITAGLGVAACWLGGQILPALRYSTAAIFLPWLAGGILGAIWMTVLRWLVHRTRFLSDAT